MWIFKTVSGLNTSPSASITGGDPCNVWWRVGSSAVLDTGTSFVGNILALTDINLLTGASLNGRVMAQTGQVVLDSNTISGPTCAPVPATIHIIKQVVNTSGGVATSSDFILHVRDGISDVLGSPAAGTTSPGTNYLLTPGTYVVSEDTNALYTASFSGDCDSSGTVTLEPGENKNCTITNTDIPGPIIPPSTSGGSGIGGRRRVSVTASASSTLSTDVFVTAITPSPTPVVGQVLGVTTYPPKLPETGYPPLYENPWIYFLGISVILVFASKIEHFLVE